MTDPITPSMVIPDQDREDPLPCSNCKRPLSEHTGIVCPVDPVPSKDALPQVTLTPEQEKRASELAVAMSMSYWGLRSAACVIVGLQDEVERLRTALRGISTCSTCEACRGAARLALGEQPPPLPDLNWMPFDAGVKFLSDRLMTVDSSWLLKHWDCKYLDVRVDMRTGAMLIRPGNTPPPGDGQ